MTRRNGAVVITGGRRWETERTVLLDALAAAVAAADPGMGRSVREYRIRPDRRFRADLAWPARRVAVDIQGGLWIRGHHVRGRGYREDVEKLWAAAEVGWWLLPVTWQDLAHPVRRAWVARILTQICPQILAP